MVFIGYQYSPFNLFLDKKVVLLQCSGGKTKPKDTKVMEPENGNRRVLHLGMV
jgi:hypothetical protein